MRKLFIIVMILGLFVSCEKSNDSQKTSNRKTTTDSLTIQKEKKAKEIKDLNSELDSLKRLNDSLKAISN